MAIKPATIEKLAEQLVSLGLKPGDVVMTHASMRRLGPVEGGASGLIEAQLKAVGPAGTLLMVLGAAEGAPFDPLTTPVDIKDMGVLAETFRSFPGVTVSDHPADRFGAIGKDADALMGPTPLHDYHGPGSPLERFTQMGGRVLRLGADPDTVTLTHYAEYLAVIPDKVRVRRRYVCADRGEVFIESLDDNEGVAAWPHGDYFSRIFLDYKSAGRLSQGVVGECVGELFDARDFVDFAVQWMNRELGEKR